MTREQLSALKKPELLDRARAIDLRGRSKMSKAELIEALVEIESTGDAHSEDDVGPMIPIPGVSQEDRVVARARRTDLYDRLADLVDQDRRCRWRSIEGHGCGLPVIRGEEACSLQSDSDR